MSEDATRTAVDRATALTRRTFLAGVSLASGAAAWRFLLQPFVFGSAADSATFEELLLASVARLPTPPEPGRAFLDRRSQLTQFDLIRALELRFRAVGPLADQPADIFRLISQSVREDIRSGRIESIESWRLTETEFEVSALRHLRRSAIIPPSPNRSYSSILLSPISDWGPQVTLSGTAFNRQPDGSSALWFRTEKSLSGLSVRLGDVDLITTEQPGLITAGLAAKELEEIVGTAGSYPVNLVVADLRAAQLVGYFHVFPHRQKEGFETWPVDLAEFLTADLANVTDWGPRETPVGRAFNPQADGRSAFWVRFKGTLKPGLFLALGGFPLPTIRDSGTLTAGMVPVLANRLLATSGSLSLQLIDPTTRLLQDLGQFQVQLTA